eukprot:5627892-Prymnesium_polylepis.1
MSRNPAQRKLAREFLPRLPKRWRLCGSRAPRGVMDEDTPIVEGLGDSNSDVEMDEAAAPPTAEE